MDALALLFACPACAAGRSDEGLLGTLLLAGMIVAPIAVAAILIPTIARILRDPPR